MDFSTYDGVLDAGLERAAAAADGEEAAGVRQPHDGVLDLHDVLQFTVSSVSFPCVAVFQFGATRHFLASLQRGVTGQLSC
jgi:hypothetical protein